MRPEPPLTSPQTSTQTAPSYAAPAAAPEPDAEGLGFALPPPTKVSRRATVLSLAALGLTLAGAFWAGYAPRQRAARERVARAQEAGQLRVLVLRPRVGASTRAVTLPGTLRALEETVIAARASGYLHRWYVDLGDAVTEGQHLADIETPELDQEQNQARATLAQATATLAQVRAAQALAALEQARATRMQREGSISQQEFDQRSAAARVAEANVGVAEAAVSAQRANLQRVSQLRQFSRVVAPFAGTITARMAERGALVSASAGTPLFRLGAMQTLRVMVQAPQDVAPSMRAGLEARVSVREFPARVFVGAVTRTAGALDPSTRTLPVEVRLNNADGALLAGMYAEAALTLTTPFRVFELPTTAVYTDAAGVRVATVSADGRVHLVPVRIVRDTGATVQIAEGLDGTERVAQLASVDLTEGRRVDAVDAPPAEQGAAQRAR